jgi:hypothetical protein
MPTLSRSQPRIMVRPAADPGGQGEALPAQSTSSGGNNPKWPRQLIAELAAERHVLRTISQATPRRDSMGAA